MVMAHLAPLDKKVVRDLGSMWAQALAIAMVMAAGVAMFVMSEGMLSTLGETRDAYYQRYGFANVFAPLKRAPNALGTRLEQMDGVRFAETRIREHIKLDMPGMIEPAQGQVLSYPIGDQPRLNRLHLVEGRWLTAGKNDEVLVSAPFIEAHQLNVGVGDKISAIMNGRKRDLTVVGIVLSAEFIYAIQPGAMMPDNQRYGIFWTSRDALEAAFDMTGAFNDLVVLTEPGANIQAVKQNIDQILEQYGGTGAYGRDLQVSDWYVTGEMKQLRNMAQFVPPIFLAIAAFLLNVVITRWIETEREEIGLMKAFGYSTGAVATHYIKIVMVITTVGVVLGYIGGIWLGRGLAEMYQEFFRFPFLYYTFDVSVFLITGAITFLAALLSTAGAVRRAAVLEPSVAMSPPVPTMYSRSWLEPFSRLLSQPSRMIVRHLVRWPLRSLMIVLGNAAAVAVLIGAMFFMDSMETLIEVSFNRAERQDATLAFVDSRDYRALDDVKTIPGVLHVEPFRNVPARLSFEGRERRETLSGIVPGAEFTQILDQNFRPVDIPERGLVLSQKLAELLGAGVGDVIVAQVTDGRRPLLELPVVQVSQTLLGSPAFMNFDYLSQLMQEGGQMDGVHVSLDENRQADFFKLLKDTPAVAGVTLKTGLLQSFRDTMAENVLIMTFFNIIFAGVIALGVIYNAARLSLSERARELASLRVLGFTLGEVSYILLGELAVLILVAFPLGCLFGYGLAWLWTMSLDTELYRIPLVVSAQTYGLAILVVVGSAILSGFATYRSLKKLDLVEALKTRE